MARLEKEQSVGAFNPDTGDSLIHIEYGGMPYTLKIAETEEELREVKALDDLAFEGQMGISMEELEEIQRHGAVIMLKDQYGRLVGETQVITSPMGHHPNMASDEAYNYGTAIDPNQQSAGLGQLLFRAQEIIAKQAGKNRSTLTVRLENAKSIRGRFKAGYHVVAYDPDCYPEEENSARLVMEKHHEEPLEVHDPDVLSNEFRFGDGAMLVMRHNVELVLTPEPKIVGVPVKAGDEKDIHAHEVLAVLAENTDILGVGLLHPREIDIISEHSVLVLRSEAKVE